MGQLQAAESWLRWAVELCISWSLHLLEVQQAKDDAQASLQCIFFSVCQTLVKNKWCNWL